MLQETYMNVATAARTRSWLRTSGNCMELGLNGDEHAGPCLTTVYHKSVAVQLIGFADGSREGPRQAMAVQAKDLVHAFECQGVRAGDGHAACRNMR